MLLVNELLFAYFSIGPSSKFNLWDYCYDDIQQRIPYSHHCPSWYFASKRDFSEIEPPHPCFASELCRWSRSVPLERNGFRRL